MNDEGYKNCPYCGEEIKIEAIKCKHCQTMLNNAQNISKPDSWPGQDQNTYKGKMLTAGPEIYEVETNMRKYNNLAVISLVLGVIGAFLLLAIKPICVLFLVASLVTGFLGFKSANRNYAVAGLVLSGLALVTFLMFYVAAKSGALGRSIVDDYERDLFYHYEQRKEQESR